MDILGHVPVWICTRMLTVVLRDAWCRPAMPRSAHRQRGVSGRLRSQTDHPGASSLGARGPGPHPHAPTLRHGRDPLYMQLRTTNASREPQWQLLPPISKNVKLTGGAAPWSSRWVSAAIAPRTTEKKFRVRYIGWREIPTLKVPYQPWAIAEAKEKAWPVALTAAVRELFVERVPIRQVYPPGRQAGSNAM